MAEVFKVGDKARVKEDRTPTGRLRNMVDAGKTGTVGAVSPSGAVRVDFDNGKSCGYASSQIQLL